MIVLSVSLLPLIQVFLFHLSGQLYHHGPDKEEDIYKQAPHQEQHYFIYFQF